MHADTSARQLGSAIAQDNRPIAFYSKKLSKSQKNRTVTDLELLSIAMTLRELRSILLGQNALIHADYKNLESELAHLALQMGLRWRLLIEEHGIQIKCAKGEKNQVAGALSRLEHTPQESTPSETVDLLFGLLRAEDTGMFPLNMQEIAIEQAQDGELKQRMTAKSNRARVKRAANDKDIILENGKVFAPLPFRQRVLNWHHR